MIQRTKRSSTAYGRRPTARKGWKFRSTFKSAVFFFQACEDWYTGIEGECNELWSGGLLLTTCTDTRDWQQTFLDNRAPFCTMLHLVRCADCGKNNLWGLVVDSWLDLLTAVNEISIPEKQRRILTNLAFLKLRYLHVPLFVPWIGLYEYLTILEACITFLILM